MSTCNGCGRYTAEYETPKCTETICYFCDEGAVILEPDEFVCKKIPEDGRYFLTQKLEERIRNLVIRKNEYSEKYYNETVKFLDETLEIIKSMEIRK